MATVKKSYRQWYAEDKTRDIVSDFDIHSKGEPVQVWNFERVTFQEYDDFVNTCCTAPYDYHGHGQPLWYHKMTSKNWYAIDTQVDIADATSGWSSVIEWCTVEMDIDSYLARRSRCATLPFGSQNHAQPFGILNWCVLM